MSKLTRRRIRPEMMDDPNVDREALRRSLRFIRRVNRLLGGTSAVLNQLGDWTSAWPRERVLNVLDLGTGSADIPRAILHWAHGRGRTAHITAVDRHQTTLSIARKRLSRDDAMFIDLVEADALTLGDRFAPGSFDVVHAGMFLHHLHDEQVMELLRTMYRLCSLGLIWNDLIRGPVERIGVRLLTVGQPKIVRHDARISVAAGFTRREATSLALRSGLRNVQFSRHIFGRFTLISRK